MLVVKLNNRVVTPTTNGRKKKIYTNLMYNQTNDNDTTPTHSKIHQTTIRTPQRQQPTRKAKQKCEL